MTELVLHLPRQRTAVMARLRTLTAAEIALGTTVAAVAALPLLVPNGPSTPMKALLQTVPLRASANAWRVATHVSPIPGSQG